MHRLRIAGALALALATLAGVPASAAAQGWLSDRDTAQGPGVRIGNFVLHPGFGIEGGYDTNLFREDNGVTGAALLRMTAHAFLENLRPSLTPSGVEDGASESASGQRRVHFRLGGSASYLVFFEDRADNNLAATGEFLLTYNPEGRLSATLENLYTRTVRPFVDATTVDAAPSFARNINETEARFILGSRGRVFQSTLGYRFRVDFFEDQVFDYANSFTHRPYLNFSYRFLPQTAVVAETTVRYRTYPSAAGAPTVLPDGTLLTTRVGLNGALSNRVSFSLVAGYSAGFFDALDDFDSPNVRAELRWRPRPSLAFATGYDRRFTPSFVGSFVRTDDLYASVRILAFGSFLLQSRLSVSFNETGLAISGTGDALGTQNRRQDTRVSSTTYTEYRFTDWLAVTASLNVLVDITDFQFIEPPDGTVFPDPAGGFVSIEALAGLRVFY